MNTIEVSVGNGVHQPENFLRGAKRVGGIKDHGGYPNVSVGFYEVTTSQVVNENLPTRYFDDTVKPAVPMTFVEVTASDTSQRHAATVRWPASNLAR